PPPPPQTSPLSLHDALPICAGAQAVRARRPRRQSPRRGQSRGAARERRRAAGSRQDQSPACKVGGRKFGGGAVSTRIDAGGWRRDRKSTRLNSSHLGISYAV